MILNSRKDIVTNQRYERNKLIRISILKDGTTDIDKDYSKGGRGIYIHPNNINTAIEKNILKNNVKRFNGDYDKVVELLNKEVSNG